jgi:hypothetical protein
MAQRPTRSGSKFVAIQVPSIVGRADGWSKPPNNVATCVADSIGANVAQAKPRIASGVKPDRVPCCALTASLLDVPEHLCA